MAAMTMTFEVPETKLIDKESLREKLKEIINIFVSALPDKEIDETEFIMQNSEIMEAIKDGDAQIKSGNFETTKLKDLWK